MKDLNECKAEIFRRSENRIKERRKARNRLFVLSVPVVIIIAVLPIMAPMSKYKPESEEAYYESNGTVTDHKNSNHTEETKKPSGGVQGENDLELEWSDSSTTDGPPNRPSGPTSSLDSSESSIVLYNDFSFYLEWGVYQQCSYDSKTGRLVKYNDSTNPDKYATYYQLTDNQLNTLNLMMYRMDIQSYPRTYSPYGDGVMSTPSDNLILTVKTRNFEKTVYALNIPIGLKAQDAKGQKFIDVCEEIKEILFNSDEWKSLPEPELEPLI